MGDSSIPPDDDYTAETVADDVKGICDFLRINQTYVFGYDKGAGVAAALTFKYSSLVKRAGFAEYPLPGFGYETSSDPTPSWDLYSNWQLAFFSIPDAAQFFIQGRESEMLAWYFFHASYSGSTAISQADLDRYTTQISRPGFLRSSMGYFAAATVAADAAFFNTSLAQSPITQPALVLGGEASFAPASLLRELWGPVVSNLTAEIIPKAGHWPGTIEFTGQEVC